VSKDGDCCFTAIAEHFIAESEDQVIDADLLRRMAVWGLVQFAELLYPIVSTHLIGCYMGGEDSPGPFSYKSYCHYMMQAGNWGDEVVIALLGQLLNVKISLLDFKTYPPKEHTYFHNSKLGKADIVLVYDGRNHYFTACK
jgi:hypothetical protein